MSQQSPSYSIITKRISGINSPDKIFYKEGSPFIVDISAYGKAYISLINASTISFVGLPSINKSIVLSLTVICNSHVLTLPNDILWENGSIPTINNGMTQILIEFCNIGTIIKTGFLVAENIGLPT